MNRHVHTYINSRLFAMGVGKNYTDYDCCILRSPHPLHRLYIWSYKHDGSEYYAPDLSKDTTKVIVSMLIIVWPKYLSRDSTMFLKAKKNSQHSKNGRNRHDIEEIGNIHHFV